MKRSDIGILFVLALAFPGGCQEPNYRVEVTGNGQGGANIKTVPKDPMPAPTTMTAESLEEQNRRQQAEIQSLQEQIQRQQQELQKLKQPPTTSP